MNKSQKFLLLQAALICLINIQNAQTMDNDKDWEIVEKVEVPRQKIHRKALSKADIIEKLREATSAIFGYDQTYVIYIDSKDFFKKTELDEHLFEAIGQAIKYIENNKADSPSLKKQMIALQMLYHQILREPILLVNIIHNLLPKIPKTLVNPFERNLDYPKGARKELNTRLKKLREFITKLRVRKESINNETFYLPSKKNAHDVMNVLIDQRIIICQRIDFVIRNIMCLADPKASGASCPEFGTIRFERKH